MILRASTGPCERGSRNGGQSHSSPTVTANRPPTVRGARSRRREVVRCVVSSVIGDGGQQAVARPERDSGFGPGQLPGDLEENPDPVGGPGTGHAAPVRLPHRTQHTAPPGDRPGPGHPYGHGHGRSGRPQSPRPNRNGSRPHRRRRRPRDQRPRRRPGRSALHRPLHQAYANPRANTTSPEAGSPPTSPPPAPCWPKPPARCAAPPRARTSPSSAFSPRETAARRRSWPLPASPPHLRPAPPHRRRCTRDEGADATTVLTSRPLRTPADRPARATAPNPEDCEDTSDDRPHPCHGTAHDGHRLGHPARQSLVESTCPKAPHSLPRAARHHWRLGLRA